MGRERTELEVLRASRPSVRTIREIGVPVTAQVLEASILGHMGYESQAEKHLGAHTAPYRPSNSSASTVTPTCLERLGVAISITVRRSATFVAAYKAKGEA